jgi:hypothetical protein
MPSEPIEKRFPTEMAEGLPPVAADHDDRDPLIDMNVRVNEATASDVFFAWERLRIVFNVAMGIALFTKYSMWQGVGDAWLWDLTVFLFCINAYFSLGPVVEGYLCWLNVPRVRGRWLAFLLLCAGSLSVLTIWR